MGWPQRRRTIGGGGGCRIKLGLSRSEYVRRRLAQDAARPGSPVSVQDLARFTEVFRDLADQDVMSRAWQ